MTKPWDAANVLAHVPDLEKVILGGWLESLAMDGKITVDPQRVEDVRTGIRLALRWFPPPQSNPDGEIGEKS